MGKLKRDLESLRSLVWDQHTRGKSNRQIARDLKVCRNKVNELIRLGPPPEFEKKVEVNAGPVESDHHKEARLLREVEARLPEEHRQNEAILAAYFEWLKEKERRRRYGFPYLPG